MAPVASLGRLNILGHRHPSVGSTAPAKDIWPGTPFHCGIPAPSGPLRTRQSGTLAMLAGQGFPKRAHEIDAIVRNADHPGEASSGGIGPASPL